MTVSQILISTKPNHIQKIIVYAVMIQFLMGCGTASTDPISENVVYVTVTPSDLQSDSPLRGTRLQEIEDMLMAGGWGGSFKFDNDANEVLLIADFSSNATSFDVTLTFPLSSDAPQIISPVILAVEEDTTQVQFGIPFVRSGNQSVLAFEGQLQDNRLVGQISHGADVGSFELSPIADYAPNTIEESA